MLQRLFRPRPAVEAGRALRRAVSAQARQPAFYLQGGAPDTVEGRFELYVAHMVLVLHRLKGEGAQAGETSQAAFDDFLKNLDEGLRDMGVGDLSVGKKMRKLGEAVYGRIRSYDAALADPDPAAALTQVLSRTVYEAGGDRTCAPIVARYLEDSRRRLHAQPLANILTACLDWSNLHV